MKIDVMTNDKLIKSMANMIYQELPLCEKTAHSLNRLLDESPATAYEHVLIAALERIYQQDEDLITAGCRLDSSRSTEHRHHERTFTARLGYYLALLLETDDRKVDCEYFYDYAGEEHNRKKVAGREVIPDIIYHVRGSDMTKNYFCIEAKWNTVGHDRSKVRKIIEKYHYKIGFCIYKIRPNSVSMYILQNDHDTPDKKTYVLDEETKTLRYIENTNTQ